MSKNHHHSSQSSEALLEELYQSLPLPPTEERKRIRGISRSSGMKVMEIREWLKNRKMTGPYRGRPNLSFAQVQSLEWLFTNHTQYPTPELKKLLTEELRMTEYQIGKWFETRRQRKVVPVLLTRKKEQANEEEWQRSRARLLQIIAQVESGSGGSSSGSNSGGGSSGPFLPGTPTTPSPSPQQLQFPAAGSSSAAPVLASPSALGPPGPSSSSSSSSSLAAAIHLEQQEDPFYIGCLGSGSRDVKRKSRSHLGTSSKPSALPQLGEKKFSSPFRQLPQPIPRYPQQEEVPFLPSIQALEQSSPNSLPSLSSNLIHPPPSSTNPFSTSSLPSLNSTSSLFSNESPLGPDGRPSSASNLSLSLLTLNSGSSSPFSPQNHQYQLGKVNLGGGGGENTPVSTLPSPLPSLPITTNTNTSAAAPLPLTPQHSQPLIMNDSRDSPAGLKRRQVQPSASEILPMKRRCQQEEPAPTVVRLPSIRELLGDLSFHRSGPL